MSSKSDRQAALFTVLVGTCLLGLLIISTPLPTLLDYSWPDDAFYYLVPARNFVNTGFVSFDTIHPTNGFQPLWFLLNIPIFIIWPDGGLPPIRAILIVQVLMVAIATIVLFNVLLDLFDYSVAIVAGMVWFLVYLPDAVNGLETSLYALCFITTLHLFTKLTGSSPLSQYLILGTMTGLTFLARTDAAFLVVTIALAVLALRLRHKTPDLVNNLRYLIAFGLPTLLICGSYLVINYVTTGHLVPVSGAVKV